MHFVSEGRKNYEETSEERSEERYEETNEETDEEYDENEGNEEETDEVDDSELIPDCGYGQCQYFQEKELNEEIESCYNCAEWFNSKFENELNRKNGFTD